MNAFGRYGSFPIIVPLHGGGGELSQAFCRAAAVKGATYILGREIRSVTTLQEVEYSISVDFEVEETEELSTVRCNHIVLPTTLDISECIGITRTVSVVGNVFESLFLPETLFKDAALIVIPPGILRPEQCMPIQVIIHGGEIGECPVGQCSSTF